MIFNKSTLLATLFIPFVFSCGPEEESSLETTSNDTIEEETPVETQENQWIMYTNEAVGYQIKFPGEPETRVDTTQMFYVHLAAHGVESPTYRVSVYEPINPKEIADPMDYLYHMEPSTNSSYTLFERNELTINERTGIQTDVSKNGWSYSRFFVFENNMMFVLDMGSEGDDFPMPMLSESFWGWFDTTRK